MITSTITYPMITSTITQTEVTSIITVSKYEIPEGVIPPNALVTEDGYPILTEDGQFILL